MGTARPSALLVLIAAACATTPRATPPPAAADHAELDATLWVQGAAEYEALARQAYGQARESLAEALADSSWTAALEQEPPYGSLPPAVIVDIDETVLDNTPYQARRIQAGGGFTPESWATWIAEAQAPAIPGAVEFARRADSLGVTLFYVTNRDAELEADTRRNLEAAGFPLEAGGYLVLTRGEREEWTSDKGTRRAEVAERYRVLLLIGDDLNDFVSARVPRAEREALVRTHGDRWGRHWFLLPNPIYGSWEDALSGFESGLSPEEVGRRKRAALETAEP